METAILYIVIIFLALVTAGLISIIVILNSPKFETKREFEIRQKTKYRKGGE